MNRTAAIIDMGTNTFNMLVVNYNRFQFRLLHQQKEAVKLGEGGISENRLTEEAMKRAVQAIDNHMTVAKKLGARQFIATATSAVRSATNGNVLTQKITQQFNLQVDVIDGQREAELIYKGVKLAVHSFSENALIMDIGGGSTEFILCNNNGVIWQHSFNLGAARLLEWLKPSNPITSSEVDQLHQKLENDLQPLFQAIASFKPTVLIGSSGSFDSLHEMICHREHVPEKAYEHLVNELTEPNYSRICKEIIHSTTKERLAIPGLIAMRVDMIVIAVLFIEFIKKRLQLSSIKQCQYALKEGILFELMQSNP